jgi:hypothetical protein
MQGLTGLQDTNPSTPQYWFLWGLFADAVKRAKWVSRLDTDRHPDGTGLLSAVFLTLHWKDNVRHWRFLDGYAHLVQALVEALPSTSTVLDDYARFLYHIGERSLPDAFVRGAVTRRRCSPSRTPFSCSRCCCNATSTDDRSDSSVTLGSATLCYSSSTAWSNRDHQQRFA